MAMKFVRDTDPETKKARLQISIDNGDLKALDTVLSKWKFKDEESMLGFALAVLLRAKNPKLYVDDEDGQRTVLEPVNNLLKHVEQPSEPDNGTETK